MTLGLNVEASLMQTQRIIILNGWNQPFLHVQSSQIERHGSQESTG